MPVYLDWHPDLGWYLTASLSSDHRSSHRQFGGAMKVLKFGRKVVEMVSKRQSLNSAALDIGAAGE
jgi:hypothetical protein